MKFKYWTVSGVTDSRGKVVKRPILELELTGLSVTYNFQLFTPKQSAAADATGHAFN